MQTRLMLTIDSDNFEWLEEAAMKSGVTKSQMVEKLLHHFRGIPPQKESLTVKRALESWRAFLPDPDQKET